MVIGYYIVDAGGRYKKWLCQTQDDFMPVRWRACGPRLHGAPPPFGRTRNEKSLKSHSTEKLYCSWVTIWLHLKVIGNLETASFFTVTNQEAYFCGHLLELGLALDIVTSLFSLCPNILTFSCSVHLNCMYPNFTSSNLFGTRWCMIQTYIFMSSWKFNAF